MGARRFGGLMLMMHVVGSLKSQAAPVPPNFLSSEEEFLHGEDGWITGGAWGLISPSSRGRYA